MNPLAENDFPTFKRAQSQTKRIIHIIYEYDLDVIAPSSIIKIFDNKLNLCNPFQNMFIYINRHLHSETNLKEVLRFF